MAPKAQAFAGSRDHVRNHPTRHHVECFVDFQLLETVSIQSSEEYEELLADVDADDDRLIVHPGSTHLLGQPSTIETVLKVEARTQPILYLCDKNTFRLFSRL